MRYLLLGLAMAGVALLVVELRSAPEGYEDGDGFHYDRH
jgi:hypothetical protein